METKQVKKAPKKMICENMKAITKETLGRSWDMDTCNFAYDLVIEAIKRTLKETGKVTIEHFIRLELRWKEARKVYQALIHDGTYTDVPAKNIVIIKPIASFRKEIAEIKTPFVEAEKRKMRGKNVEV